MKDYASMSDQEINMHVASIIYPESTVIESKSRPPCACITGHIPSYWVDYCNNPADAWPILLENHISIAPYKNATPCAWPSSEGLISNHVTEDANPLRAGMITFLKMKESEND